MTKATAPDGVIRATESSAESVNHMLASGPAVMSNGDTHGDSGNVPATTPAVVIRRIGPK